MKYNTYWTRINRLNWSRERAFNTPVRSRGLAKKHASLYRTYYNILSRCNNKNHPRYKNYGAKGIKCYWYSFEDFINDMSEEYYEHIKKYGKRQTSIDRINNSDSYYKENCRWTTWDEQFKTRGT